VTADGVCQANAPQRRGSPLTAVGEKLAALVGQAFAHIVQQQVAVGIDALSGQLRLGGVARRGETGGMAAGAASLVEQALAGQYLGAARLTALRNGQVACVEEDFGEDVVADFRLAAVRRLATGLLARAAVVMGNQRGGQAHVIGKGIGILLVEGRLSGLPAEAAQGIVLAGVIPDLVGATADTVAVTVVGVGVGKNVARVDGFEQAQTNHRRGDAHGKLCVGMQWAVAQAIDLQLGSL